MVEEHKMKTILLSLLMVKLFVITSGSMRPALSPGDVILVRKSAEYSPGEIVAYLTSDRSTVVVHRIKAVEQSSDDIRYTTQGDANNRPDTHQVADQQIIGTVIAKVPKIGIVVFWLRSLPGLALTAIIGVTELWSTRIRVD